MYVKFRRFALLLASASTLVFGSCITNAQFWDFGRTEVARVISDTIGQFVFNSLLSGSSNPGIFQ